MGEPPGDPRPPDRPARPRRRSFPARLLGGSARGAQAVARATGIDDAVELAAEEAVVRAVESEAFENALERVLRGPTFEAALGRALDSPEVERSLTTALDSKMVDRLWEQLLASDEVQKLVERIAEAPEVRAAITSQGVGLIEDLGRAARRAARRLDDVAERIVRRVLFRRLRDGATNRAGLITRGFALLVDAAILNGAFLAVSAAIAFLVNEFGGGGGNAPASVIVAGAGLWLIAGAAYLLVFWTLAGQTPGMRFLGIRLDQNGARRIGLGDAVRRVLGLALAVIPLGLGLLGIATGERRCGWQDRWAGTEVVYAEDDLRRAPWSAGPASDPRAGAGS